MISPLFSNGIQGLSDSLWSGTAGSCSKLVGIDYRTVPGTFQAHQKLSKHSSTTVTELCKNVVNCSDGSILWFSSESGKIWREVSGTYTLVQTTVPTDGEAKCLGAIEYDEAVFWATENYLHYINVEDLDDWTQVQLNWNEFFYGDDEFHPMVVQNLNLYIGDKITISKVERELPSRTPNRSFTITFGTSVDVVYFGTGILPSISKYPSEIVKNRSTSASASSINHDVTIPDRANRVMLIYLATVQTDGVATVMPDTISVGSQTATALQASTTANLGATNEAAVRVYKLVSPTAGTQTVTATFPGAESNILMETIVFRDARDITTVSAGDIGGTSFITSAYTGDIEDFTVPIMFALSPTTTHTYQDTKLEIYNTTNTFGRDSLYVTNVYPETFFTDLAEFNLVSPERIQTMADFDIDILVGTRDVNKGRVLRWDGVSEGWSAQDDIEEQGINAFIRDDNFMYVQAGFYGRMYFYNGEKLDPYKRIPGDWSPSKTAKINANSTAFHLGVPVFGLSNNEGNPVLQGVYGFGSYGVGYTKSLSLDYPIPTNAFTGVEIGAMVTDGADLYVSYKDATDVGIAKLDWSNKYNGAYLETTALMSPKERSEFSVTNSFNADYTDLPANTNISFSYKKNYDDSFTATSGINFPKLKQIKARETITDISNLIVKVALTTTANDTPNVENISIEL